MITERRRGVALADDFLCDGVVCVEFVSVLSECIQVASCQLSGI